MAGLQGRLGDLVGEDHIVVRVVRGSPPVDAAVGGGPSPGDVGDCVVAALAEQHVACGQHPVGCIFLVQVVYLGNVAGVTRQYAVQQLVLLVGPFLGLGHELLIQRVSEEPHYILCMEGHLAEHGVDSLRLVFGDPHIERVHYHVHQLILSRNRVHVEGGGRYAAADAENLVDCIIEVGAVEHPVEKVVELLHVSAEPALVGFLLQHERALHADLEGTAAAVGHVALQAVRQRGECAHRSTIVERGKCRLVLVELAVVTLGCDPLDYILPLLLLTRSSALQVRPQQHQALDTGFCIHTSIFAPCRGACNGAYVLTCTKRDRIAP